MKLSDFNFDLPSKFIAQHPSENRGDSRLMVLNRANKTIEHKEFKDFLGYMSEGDALVFNNTKVFPARMYGNKERTGARIEVFLLRELNRDLGLWDVLVDPARKIRVGNKLYFHDNNGNEILVAEVIDNTTSRGRTVRFIYDGSYDEFRKTLNDLGQTPLPKYINRPVEKTDSERYQTVYAKIDGSVAAPTAGLHFNKEILKRLEIKGVEFGEVTLHVGLGTFRSIEVEDLSKHKMDAEYFHIPQTAADIANAAHANGGKVCAVGTTSLRTIESSVSANRLLKAAEGWTNLFIFPPYDFLVADMLITNFHLPKSSLVILAAAFAGDTDFLMEAYHIAMKEKYRFYSYGDAMLIV